MKAADARKVERTEANQKVENEVCVRACIHACVCAGTVMFSSPLSCRVTDLPAALCSS